MALDQPALLELTDALHSADGGQVMRRLLLTMLQALIEAEATGQIGAARHERTETRTTQRNGSRDRLVATTAEDLTVKIPGLRTGSIFPSLRVRGLARESHRGHHRREVAASFRHHLGTMSDAVGTEESWRCPPCDGATRTDMDLGSVRRLLDACGCGHPRTLHEHYRRGTDCAASDCRCRRYRRAVLQPWRAARRTPSTGDEVS